MNRCTEWIDGHGAGLPGKDCYTRLAEYEDTGLEPEEVEALKVSSMGKAVAEITEFDGITIARLKELDRAEKAGRLEDKPQWISVKDRLPDSDGSYVVHSKKSGKVFTAHFWTRDGRWSGRSLNLTITHWMPLPEPPEEEAYG